MLQVWSLKKVDGDQRKLRVFCCCCGVFFFLLFCRWCVWMCLWVRGKRWKMQNRQGFWKQGLLGSESGGLRALRAFVLRDHGRSRQICKKRRPGTAQSCPRSLCFLSEEEGRSFAGHDYWVHSTLWAGLIECLVQVGKLGPGFRGHVCRVVLSANSRASLPEFKPWHCLELAVWPWASYLILVSKCQLPLLFCGDKNSSSPQNSSPEG